MSLRLRRAGAAGRAVACVPVLTVVVLLGVCAAPARGQIDDSRMPEPGSLVRLTYPCDTGAGPRACRVRGTFVRATPELIEIDAAGSSRVQPLGQLTRLDVAAGTRSHWQTGAVLGFVAGAGVTLMLVSAGGSGGLCDLSQDDDAMGWPACIGIAGAGGVAVGGVGALLGLLHRTTRWQEVPLR